METEVKIDLTKATIKEIADVIRVDWKNISPYAESYIDAMATMNKINDMYYQDPGSNVVRYFLANAQTWRGDVARKIKKELNRRLK